MMPKEEHDCNQTSTCPFVVENLDLTAEKERLSRTIQEQQDNLNTIAQELEKELPEERVKSLLYEISNEEEVKKIK
jgi:hypothetical protein